MEATEFTAAQLPDVQGFNCGSAVWEEPLNLWIKTEALDSIAKRGNKVWLYYEGQQVVGYGCIGQTKRPHPTGSDPKIELAIIPYVAIQTPFQGQPQGVGRDQKYSGQIMNHLIFHARKYGHDLLVLDVHPDNHRAKALYQKFGFTMIPYVRDGYERMVLRL